MEVGLVVGIVLCGVALGGHVVRRRERMLRRPVEQVRDARATAATFHCDLAVFDQPTCDGPPTCRVLVSTGTDAGPAHPFNEDAMGVSDDGVAFAVADGLGGHAEPDVASQSSVRVFLEAVSGDEPVALSGVLDRVTSAVQAANAALRVLRAQRASSLCATLVALKLTRDRRAAVLAHVGDSRGYRFRDERLERLTSDHSLAKSGGGGRVLTALGVSDDVSPDVAVLAVRPRDVFLLCSDGLTSAVSDADIEQTIRCHRASDATIRELVSATRRAGGTDDVSIVVIAVEELGTGGAPS